MNNLVVYTYMWNHIWMLCWHVVVWVDRWRWFPWNVNCLSTSWFTCWVWKYSSSTLFNNFSYLFAANLLRLDLCFNICNLVLDNWSSWLIKYVSGNILESSIDRVTPIVCHHTWHVFIVGGVLRWESTIRLILVFKISHVIDISESWSFIHMAGSHTNHWWVRARNSIHIVITFICGYFRSSIAKLFICNYATSYSNISFSASWSKEAFKEGFFGSNTILDIIDYARHTIDQTPWSITFIISDHSIINWIVVLSL